MIGSLHTSVYPKEGTHIKILLYDIETSHNLVAAFRLYEDYTPPENVIQERFVISVAWKWLGEKKTHVVSVLDDPKLFKQDPFNDLHVLKTFHQVLSEADVIVAHNGDKYDIRFLEARMLIQGLDPLPPINKVDTLKVAKKRFLFNSNKLDYLGKILGVGRKIHTSNRLWLGVLKADPVAIQKMADYNKGDVELLERVFLKLRPFMTGPLNREMFGGEASTCPRCGSKKIQSRGFQRTKSRIYRRFQCVKCGGWHQAVKSETPGATTRTI